MKFEELRQKALKQPVFAFNDILKWFPKSKEAVLKVQLNLWVKKGYLQKIKRGLFHLAEVGIEDNLYLAEKILSPSYISLESALNYYSIIPDVPFTVTCITPLTTRNFTTISGQYNYHHIKKEYFFGWQTIYEYNKKFFYNIACPEKALLDFIYFNLSRFKNMQGIEEERLYFEKDFLWGKFLKMSKMFKNEKIYQAAKNLKKLYEQDKI